MKKFIDFLNETYKFGAQEVHKRNENRWGIELELIHKKQNGKTQPFQLLNYFEKYSNLKLEWTIDPTIKDFDFDNYYGIEIRTLDGGVKESELNKLKGLTNAAQNLYQKEEIIFNKTCGLHIHINLYYHPTLFDQIAALVEVDENKFYNLYPERKSSIYVKSKKEILNKIINTWKEFGEKYNYEAILRDKFSIISFLFSYISHNTAEFRILPGEAILSDKLFDYVKYALGLIDHVEGRQVVKWEDEHGKTYWFYRKENRFIISENPLKNQYSERENFININNTEDLINYFYNIADKYLNKEINEEDVDQRLNKIWREFHSNFLSKIFDKKYLQYISNIKYNNISPIDIKKIIDEFIKKYNIDLNDAFQTTYPGEYLFYILIDIFIENLKNNNQIENIKYLRIKRFLKKIKD